MREIFYPTYSSFWFGQGGEDKGNYQPLDGIFLDGEKPKRALIVEDEMFVALHLESVLEDLGIEVLEIVATGGEAFSEAIAQKPDVIFMDINLRGDIDGIEAARLILDRAEIPIVFVTAYGDEATMKRVEAVAPHAPVLQKPALPQALITAIKKVIES